MTFIWHKDKEYFRKNKQILPYLLYKNVTITQVRAKKTGKIWY